MTNQKELRERILIDSKFRFRLERELVYREVVYVRIERPGHHRRMMHVSREDLAIAKATLVLLGHKL